MKASKIPTEYLLLQAQTISDWDYCAFAIVHLSEEWKQEKLDWLGYVEPLKSNSHFQSMNFYDTAVEFHQTDNDDNPDLENLLADREWVFVELDERELETFALPESALDCYRFVLRSDGTAYYKAYGKHTGEEFSTWDFDVAAVCGQ